MSRRVYVLLYRILRALFVKPCNRLGVCALGWGFGGLAWAMPAPMDAPTPLLALAGGAQWGHVAMASLTGLVFVAALMLAWVIRGQNRRLHLQALDAEGSWWSRLPPMLRMESLLVRLLWVGFALLTGLMISGMFFAEEVWGAPMRWTHKVVFSWVGWGLLAVLLLGRHGRGWRGETLVRFTLLACGALFLAYVGTHIVLDLILQRGAS